ncbi:unnamed protein product [Lampetra planeri]
MKAVEEVDEIEEVEEAEEAVEEVDEEAEEAREVEVVDEAPRGGDVKWRTPSRADDVDARAWEPTTTWRSPFPPKVVVKIEVVVVTNVEAAERTEPCGGGGWWWLVNTINVASGEGGED